MFSHCRNCSFPLAHRNRRIRGLCWRCSTDPEAKRRFPSQSKYAPSPTERGNYRAPLPPQPTSTQPGSEERIRVLAERAAKGMQLFHPMDVRIATMEVA